ncbi:prokaryotic type I DNA topoisomerase [Dothidotthia symphoricarpi CBS 119687]|uniref:DNA topoisomerase n=1 Tax=Dothidotthia symphoricarpi CBS 119687 TaxID=1392245 RepID=A0A6A6A1J7_9PLEO|nr:prokaryotic type I DNA topoisomerase [Dothidotthia symphoricarpi CBS 119687]KAF2125690.1 prokaryotic type I DNA topoisomerase [Dothidotthia symphoricarpi CBS 119687]
MTRVLCVAEKPSIAKAVANHLAGQARAENVNGVQWVKNYKFDFRFQKWGQCSVTFTCVAGHIVAQDFHERFRKWHSCQPGDLFEAPIQSAIAEDKKAVATNIQSQSRYADILFIWTDCDREGEHIGTEIRDIALKSNPNMEVWRARFSNIERAHVVQASQNPIRLDEAQAQAVSARIELDLRLGAAFTRMQTLALQNMIPVQGEQRSKLISYGSCQFPTLGFVVDRYLRVRNFVPEPFWYIKIMHNKDDIEVKFNWRRGHLFDRMAVILIFERCLMAKTAKVIKMAKKPTRKWKPLPLTTVELQKNGSRFLRMTSQDVMKAAEDLYTKGWISYPRTETDQFDRVMDLRALVSRQTQDGHWGGFAQNLMNGGFSQPRDGRNNDKAHPPIHPVNYVKPTSLNDNERRVYEFVVRRFLACCSEDAVGEATDVEVDYGGEVFHAHGLTVIARNYLEVYPYDKWESSQALPMYTVGESWEPTEANLLDGETSAPSYLTEPELIALMDVNGIGTDATMAEHIAKIKEREYVIARLKGGGAVSSGSGASRGRGRGRGGGGRGGRGGRGGAAAAQNGAGGATGGIQEFIPTTLGVALIEGYDNVGFETSLSKPFLRKEMEVQMKAICEGRSTRNDVVQKNLEQYRAVFNRTVQQINVLKSAITKYVVNANQG